MVSGHCRPKEKSSMSSIKLALLASSKPFSFSKSKSVPAESIQSGGRGELLREPGRLSKELRRGDTNLVSNTLSKSKLLLKDFSSSPGCCCGECGIKLRLTKAHFSVCGKKQKQRRGVRTVLRDTANPYNLVYLPNELLGSMMPCVGAIGLSRLTRSCTMLLAASSQTALLWAIRGVTRAAASNCWAIWGKERLVLCCFWDVPPPKEESNWIIRSTTGLAAKLLGRLTLVWIGKYKDPIGVRFNGELRLGSGVNDLFRHSSSPGFPFWNESSKRSFSKAFFYKLFDDTHILTTTFINHPHFRFFKHGAVEGSVAIHSRLGIWCEYQIF